MRKPTERQRRLAEKVILEGKSFRQSAVEVGYSQVTADKGPHQYSSDKPGMQAAFILAAQKAEMNADVVKQVSKYRLFSSIVAGKACENARDIEVLGRFKDHDWFVRNTDIQIGVFASLADDAKAVASVEELKALLPEKTESSD